MLPIPSQSLFAVHDTSVVEATLIGEDVIKRRAMEEKFIGGREVVSCFGWLTA